MVSFMCIICGAAAVVASSAFGTFCAYSSIVSFSNLVSAVSAVPTLPVKDMAAVADPAQRAAIDKNIGCITGTCVRPLLTYADSFTDG